MKRTLKKALCILLTLTLAFTVGAIGISVQATDETETPDTQPVKVTAKADSPISITEVEDYDDVFDGVLALKTEKYNIKHDYSQICKVRVINNGDKTVEYYLVVENDYDDLALNFIKSGSKASPFIIQPGETQEVELAIFAQNAEKTEYKLPIHAYVIEDDGDYCDAANVVDVTCESVALSFSKKDISTDEHTLSQTIQLTNNGEYISDVSLSVSGDAEEYVSINPIVQNYQMQKNDSVTVKLRPDLTKMKDNGITTLSGKLDILGGGKKQSFDIKFDTKGQEITSITIGELVQLQNKKIPTKKNTVQAAAVVFDMGEITYDVKGSQCTNRGKVTTDYYIDDIIEVRSKTRSVGSEDVHLYLTSRMYGGSYVDKTTTNYDYYLNGELVARSQNTGLTEVSIVELPTDNLKFGAMNTIVRDYDTDPGTHFVTAETKISLTVPAEAKLSYIGSPESLDDVRSLPDGAIYTENIFSTSDKVYIGEKTTISFNVYNRGSAAGTFDISVSDGSNTIYSKANHAIDAFSSDTISFDWTPETATSQITVSLTNTSGSDEKDTTNNTATKAITVKEHKAPTISSVSDVSVVYGETVLLSANVQNADDVTNVAFYVDDTLVEGAVKNGVKGAETRYYIAAPDYNIGSHEIKAVVTYSTGASESSDLTGTATLTVADKDWEVPVIVAVWPASVLFGHTEYIDVDINNGADVKNIQYYVDGNECTRINNDLSAGTHELRVVVTYETSPGVTDAVEKTQNFTVLTAQESSFTFTLDEAFKNPSFRLLNYYSEYYYDSSYPSITSKDGVYTLPLENDMYHNPADYVLYISTDAGFIYLPLTAVDRDIQISDCKKLSYAQKTGLTIKNINVQSVNGKPVSMAIAKEESLYLLPGTYQFSVSYTYKGRSFSKNINVEIVDKDVVFDLTTSFKEFTFKFTEEVDGVNARMYYKTQWGYNYDSMYTSAEEDAGVYTAFLTSEESLNHFDSSEEVFILVWTKDSVFKNVVKPSAKAASDSAINLSKSSLKKITLVVEDSKTVKVERVGVQGNDFYADLYSDVIYLPEGDYRLSVACRFNEKSLIQKDYTVNLTKDQEIKLNNDLSAVTVTWSEAFKKTGASISAYGNNNHSFSATIDSGDKVSVQKDTYRTNIYLYRNNSYYQVVNNALDLSAGDATWDIADVFDGKIANTFNGSYSGKSYIRIELQELKDKNANQLSYFNSNSEDDNLKGFVIFENVDNPEDIYKVPVSLDSIYSFTVDLPNTTGTYNVFLELSTDNATEQEERSCENGHNWGEWEYNNDAKFFKEGTCTRKCLNCGETETKTAEGTARWHEYVYGGKHCWVTVTAVLIIAFIVRIVLHYTFWYIPWM